MWITRFIYHQQQGYFDISTPSVDGKEVDLWLLRKEVAAVGGFNEVSRSHILPRLFFVPSRMN